MSTFFCHIFICLSLAVVAISQTVDVCVWMSVSSMSFEWQQNLFHIGLYLKQLFPRQSIVAGVRP